MLRAQDVERMVKTGGSTRRPEDGITPCFKPGDAVRTRNRNPLGHTRMARYARGKRGTIHHDHGVFVFPDTSAHGLGDKPQHLYSVRFEARELWGDTASAADAVYIDLWDDYLEPA
jgi:nitrile hydratase